jgi:uncharacterized protein (DUF433 family)
MAKNRDLYAELNSLREEVRALKEQVASYTARPPMPTDHPYIVRIRGMRGGEPIIRGAYISVRAIIERTRLGETPEQVLEAYEKLTLAQVYDALSYYHDHTDEIEGYIRENEEAGKETMKLSREFLRRIKRNRKRRAARLGKARKHAK